MDDIPQIIEVSLFLLLAFLIGCVLGFLIRKLPVYKPARSSTKDEAGEIDPLSQKDTSNLAEAKLLKEAAPETASGDESSNQVAARPATLKAPRNNEPDNLKKIKGIGPKIESGLHELGVYHFDQIAGWNKQTTDWVDDHLSFKGRIERDDWVGQARTLSRVEKGNA